MIKFNIFYCKWGYYLVKIAIFGGSFDPPHKGHQEIVKRAVDILDIDKLLIVPAFLNPFKSSTLTSPQQRLRWCHSIFDTVESVEICDYEIDMQRAVYSSETIEYLNGLYRVEYMIIGADNLSSIERWHRFDWIDSQITWVVAKRSNIKIDRDILTHSIVLNVDEDISSTSIRESRDLSMVDEKIKLEVKNLLQRQNMNIDDRVDSIVKILDDKKAEEIEVFNLDDVDYIAKRVVIANSLGGKHTPALFDHLKNGLKPQGEEFLASDESDDWVAADLGDILIHIMTPEYRERYSLEKFLSELK